MTRISSLPWTAALALCAAVTTASAQTTYTCSGVPKGAALAMDGTVLVESLGGMSWPVLCGTVNPVNGVSTAACKTFYASLLLAQATGRTMTLWFTNTAGSCGAIAPWGLAAGFYFSRVDG